VAFEAFRAQSEAPARAGRNRQWYALSIGVPGALVVGGIAYSFWHIDELSPPLLKVTFLSAAPPPPPAPPPPAGGGTTAKKKIIPKPKVVVPKPEIVQPKEIPKKEEPKEEPKAEDHGEKDGVKGGTIGGTPGGTIGGVKGGTIGGTPGGTIGAVAPAAPKFLPPNMAKQQLIDGPSPDLPPALNRGDYLYRVLVQICVSTTGAVDKVTLKMGADPLLNEAVLSKVKTWKFRALMANNVPVPFCYPATFEFKRQ
jgi:hypothetical protein